MLPFFVAFIFVVLGMPSLIQLAVQKDLLDEPSEDRKIHKRSVPRLGGVLVFLGTLFTTCLLVHPEGEEAISFLRLAAGSLILFFLGLKDDLTGVNPIKKLAAQICVGYTKPKIKYDANSLINESYVGQKMVLRKFLDIGVFYYK